MKTIKLAVPLLLLLALTAAQGTAPVTSTLDFNLRPINKGLTFQATVFPSYENSWTGRFSCNNCNPFEGDQPCSKELPILCISHHKIVVRPKYIIPVQITPFAVQDGGYYEGQWRDNKMTGFGKLYYDNNQIAYEGFWLDDEFSGKGRVFNDHPEFFEGSF